MCAYVYYIIDKLSAGLHFFYWTIIVYFHTNQAYIIYNVWRNVKKKKKTVSSRARPEVTDKFTHEMLQKSLVVWYCLQYQAINLQISNISFLYPDCSARYKVILCLHMELTDSSPDLSLILWLHFNVIMGYFIIVTLNVIAIVLNVYQLFWIPSKQLFTICMTTAKH